jgi:Tol biopolymer transport system component
MKQIIRAFLFLLAVGSLTFASQISCRKAVAQTIPTGSTTPKVLFTVNSGTPAHDSAEHPIPGSDSTIYIQIASTLQTELYYCNLDGSNPTPIEIPSGLILVNGPGVNVRLTPDGSMVIFEAATVLNGPTAIYSMSLTGANLKTIVTGSSSYGGVGLLDVN